MISCDKEGITEAEIGQLQYELRREILTNDVMIEMFETQIGIANIL